MEKWVVLYLRLSDQDDRVGESASIQGQRALLNQYIREFPELSGCPVMEIVDDGVSGTSFERPGMCRLLSMVEEKKVGCIVVKDLSRFGRNYLEAGYYLETVFPLLGVRFLSAGENFDSDRQMGAAGNLEIGFKNLLSQMYSRDLSKKIVSIRRMKAEEGCYLGGSPPYGYLRGEGKKLIRDPECDMIVREIFLQYSRGMGLTEIAHLLSEKGVYSPGMLKRKRKGKNAVTGGWNAATISKILSDQRYVGDSVYGKEKPVSIGSKKSKPVDSSQWIIRENAHEPIIDRALFWEIQRMRNRRKKG